MTYRWDLTADALTRPLISASLGEICVIYINFIPSFSSQMWILKFFCLVVYDLAFHNSFLNGALVRTGIFSHYKFCVQLGTSFASQIHRWAEVLRQDLPNQSLHGMWCVRSISSLCLAFWKVFIVAVCKTRVRAENKNILLVAMGKALWHKDLKSFMNTTVASQQPSGPHSPLIWCAFADSGSSAPSCTSSPAEQLLACWKPLPAGLILTSELAYRDCTIPAGRALLLAPA